MSKIVTFPGQKDMCHVTISFENDMIITLTMERLDMRLLITNFKRAKRRIYYKLENQDSSLETFVILQIDQKKTINFDLQDAQFIEHD